MATTLNPILRYVRRTVEPADTRGLTDRQLLQRYRARKDEAAFAALVQRHGKLVLSACRQVLSEPADVEDAFQATFLVLVRKANVIRWKASIGNWLYGVAHRVAVRARADAPRRQQREGQATSRAKDNGPPDLTWREAVAVLHEELDGLPDRFRMPLLLCYLNGLSRDEAAAQLGWSATTIKGRLETGRKQLRGRLSRRGVELCAGLLAVLASNTARACRPRSLGRRCNWRPAVRHRPRSPPWQ